VSDECPDRTCAACQAAGCCRCDEEVTWLIKNRAEGVHVIAECVEALKRVQATGRFLGVMVEADVREAVRMAEKHLRGDG